MSKRVWNIAINLFLVAVSLLVSAIALEVGLNIYKQSTQPQAEHTPLYITTEKAYLYGMNPEHKKVNRHGLRDNNFSIKKPGNTFRILVLGDSIAYGRVVRSSWTFPNRLETLLNENTSQLSLLSDIEKFEVINAGVSGYTAYNELQYYLEDGRNFEPDLVIVAFCMNDIVNPRLHWNHTQNKITNIPDEAIPNLQYDREVIQPLLENREKSILRKLNDTKSFFRASIKQTTTYKTIAGYWEKMFPSPEQQAIIERIPEIEDGMPTYITGEDDISIELLTDSNSREWQWLTGIYQQLQQSTSEDNIPLMLAIFPLAYQLDPDYPHLPQNLFARYCQQNNIPCLDFLPAFRQQGKEKLFMLNKERGYDIWHLTADGHMAAAELLFEYLIEHSLMHQTQTSTTPNTKLPKTRTKP